MKSSMHSCPIRALAGLVFLALGSGAASAQFPMLCNFDADTPFTAPATGGWHQPGSVTGATGGSVLVRPMAGGLNDQPVVLYDDDGDYLAVEWNLIQIIIGELRVEASMSIPLPFSGVVLQTTTPSGVVLTRLNVTSGGLLYDAASGSTIGNYTVNQPFRVQMNIDSVSHTWSAAVDPELDGFADDPTITGLPFLNSGVSMVGRVVASLNAQGSMPGTVVYDDVYFGPGTLGQTVCQGVVNSTGVPARLAAIGSPYLSQGYLRLEASGLPFGEFGYFLASRDVGGSVPPGSSGILCLGGTIARFRLPTQIFQAPSTGLQADLSAIPLNPTVAVLPGEHWVFQGWYRDGGTSNFTDALRIQFLQ